MLSFVTCWFFWKSTFMEKFCQECHQSVKQFGANICISTRKLYNKAYNEWHTPPKLYRECNMSAHVLLKLLNKLGKRHKMWGLPSISSLFPSQFNKFNNTRAWMLDSIYHMTLITLKSYFWRKKSYNCVFMYGTLLWTS